MRDSQSKVVKHAIFDPRVLSENEIRSAPDQGYFSKRPWQRELTVSYIFALFVMVKVVDSSLTGLDCL